MSATFHGRREVSGPSFGTVVKLWPSQSPAGDWTCDG